MPHSADTRYLTHDYFRYIGKFPPQLAAYFIKNYSIPGTAVLDPMCGGGTTLIEAKLAGIDSIGFDVNPLALLISRVTTRYVEPKFLQTEIDEIQNYLNEPAKPIQMGHLTFRGESDHFFSDDAKRDICAIQRYINNIENPEIRDFFTLALMAILRKVSLANVKKMNVVIDPLKSHSKPVIETYVKQLEKMFAINLRMEMIENKAQSNVVECDARTFPGIEKKVGLAVLHPPYLTNTAFSEFARLQLSILNVDQKKIWNRELRNRGSYAQEPNGLKKYLVGWHNMLKNCFNVLEPGGYCAIVVGDGQIDYVRISVGQITSEFCADIGFKKIRQAVHRLNNNTGLTLSHKMRGQHVLIVRKDSE